MYDGFTRFVYCCVNSVDFTVVVLCLKIKSTCDDQNNVSSYFVFVLVCVVFVS